MISISVDSLHIGWIWLELEDEPAGNTDGIEPSPSIPYARRNSLKISGRDKNTLLLQFHQGPEINAIRQGKWFSPQSGSNFVGLFEGTFTNTEGVLKPVSESGGYSIDETDLLEAEFSAYIVRSGGTSAIDIEVVDYLTPPRGPKQIQILPGGRAVVSPELVGKNIKVRCVYPKGVVLREKNIQGITVRIVAQDRSSLDIKLISIRHCKLNETSAKNQLSLNIANAVRSDEVLIRAEVLEA